MDSFGAINKYDLEKEEILESKFLTHSLIESAKKFKDEYYLLISDSSTIIVLNNNECNYMT